MFGNGILNLLGQQDPRQRLLASATGQGGVRGATPAAGGGMPGSAPPAAPPQPSATSTAPDMLELYTALNDRSRKENAIDRGVTLIAAGLSDPAYKQGILNSMPSGQTDNSQIMDMVMGINEQQRAIAEKAAQVQAGMAAATEMGIDPETAQYLAETGQLGNLITSRLSTKATPRPTQVIGDATNGYRLIDTGTGEVIERYKTKGAAANANQTADIENYEYYRKDELAKGNQTPKSFEDWRLTKPPSSSVTVNNNAPGNGLADVDQDLIGLTDKELVTVGTPAAKSALNTIGSVSNASQILNKPGGVISGSALSPYEFEGRKALASVFGIDDQAVNNTAEFQSVLTDVVMGKISALGTGSAISNADLIFTKEGVGTGGTVPVEAIPRILRTVELGSYNEILMHNAKVDAAIAAREYTDPATGQKMPIDPRTKAALEAQKVPVPKVSIPDEAIAELKTLAATATPEERAQLIKEFDEAFGSGAETLLMVP